MASATLKFAWRSIVSKRNDISQQIRKYLNGELDAHAMHQLEKEALNDPFLMDALEGYENTGTDQQKNIDELNARLQSRINKSERRIIPWRAIAIAASVLIMLGFGGLFIKNYHPDEKPKAIALADKARVAPTDTVKADLKKSKLIATNIPKIVPPKPARAVYRSVPGKNETVTSASPSAAADMAPAPPTGTIVDTTKLAEVAIVGYGTQKKSSVTGSVSTVTGKDIKADDRSAYKVAGTNNSRLKTITGIVKDELGEPLPGAVVMIKGTKNAVATNSAGRFKLDSVPDLSTLITSFVGYNSKSVLVNRRDTLVISIQPNQSALSEVVVTNYGTQDKQEQEYQAAHPQNGWGEFSKYLKEKAKSPDGKTGIVKVSFIVNTDNSLSDFKILKSLSPETDAAAIDLINDGPGWVRSTDNKPEKVRVRIKFTSGK